MFWYAGTSSEQLGTI